MPVEPVPITPTRLPARSTPSCGQRALWCHSPSKSSSPSIAGRCGIDRLPQAMTQYVAEYVAPSSVVTCQRSRSSS